MKKKFYLLLGVIALLCACSENGVVSYAPGSVAGKTITVNGTSAGTLHIAFTSNSSATIKRNDGKSVTFSSVRYSKSSATSATLNINGVYINFGSSSATDNENLSLTFTSPNQGVVSGSYNRRWNDGRTMNGTIEYESFTIF